jgi:hypothetical protein
MCLIPAEGVDAVIVSADIWCQLLLFASVILQRVQWHWRYWMISWLISRRPWESKCPAYPQPEKQRQTQCDLGIYCLSMLTPSMAGFEKRATTYLWDILLENISHVCSKSYQSEMWSFHSFSFCFISFDISRVFIIQNSSDQLCQCSFESYINAHFSMAYQGDVWFISWHVWR